MPLEIVTVPCLSDNYAFLGHDPTSGQTFLVDAPEAAPILAALNARAWTLNHVLITHHHGDHVDGLAEILTSHPDALVVGAANDAKRLPPLHLQVTEGDSIEVGGESAHVIDVSGHTLGHIAFHFPTSGVVFTADSLMALGCGRVFEGTMAQMWESLSKLAALPPETLVCSGHEYTAANGRFAATIDPDNPALQARLADIATARSQNKPTVPSVLSLELATNPFLRAANPDLALSLGLHDASAGEIFAEIRRRKDSF